jgi:hypothetical protein
VNFDFFISKILRSKQLRFCQIPLILNGHILRDRVKALGRTAALAGEEPIETLWHCIPAGTVRTNAARSSIRIRVMAKVTTANLVCSIYRLDFHERCAAIG